MENLPTNDCVNPKSVGIMTSDTCQSLGFSANQFVLFSGNGTEIKSTPGKSLKFDLNTLK